MKLLGFLPADGELAENGSHAIAPFRYGGINNLNSPVIIDAASLRTRERE